MLRHRERNTQRPRHGNTHHLDNLCLAFVFQAAFQVLGSALLLLLEYTGGGAVGLGGEPRQPWSLRPQGSENWQDSQRGGETPLSLGLGRSSRYVGRGPGRNNPCAHGIRNPPWWEGPDST